MPSGKKKIGGVKKTERRGADPAVSAPPSKKKIGGVTVVRGFGTSRQMESCPEHCPGEYIEGGYWIHSSWCKWAAVLWNAHGFTRDDWKCPFNCEPQQLPSGWTHDWRCQFWERTGRTPFDHNAPKEAKRVAETASGNQSGFDKFPEALTETDDDLPF